MGRMNKYTDVFKHIDMSPVHPSTCWLWRASVNDKGLAYFTVGNRKYRVSRLVYWLTHPDFDIDNRRIIIRHKCTDAHGRNVDNPLCCNPDHMETGTHEDNMRDVMERGRRGLTNDVVRAIIETIEKFPELTHSQIAKIVGDRHQITIARTTVTDINTGRRRKLLRDKMDAESRRIDESVHLEDDDEKK